MEDIENIMTGVVCDYITNHIRNNVRVTVMLTEEERERLRNLGMNKDLKGVLNDMVKLIPDNIYIQMRGKK